MLRGWAEADSSVDVKGLGLHADDGIGINEDTWASLVVVEMMIGRSGSMFREWAEVDRSVDVERSRLCIDNGIGINEELRNALFEAFKASIDASILATACASASMAACNFKTFIEFGGGLAIADGKLRLEGLNEAGTLAASDLAMPKGQEEHHQDSEVLVWVLDVKQGGWAQYVQMPDLCYVADAD